MGIFILTLLSCGSDSGSESKTVGPWHADNVVLEYNKTITPSKSGEIIKENIFKIPGKIGIGEVAKVNFIFNSQNFLYFKLLHVGNSCNKKDLKISTRVINLESGGEAKFINGVLHLDPATDYAIEIWASSSSCNSVEVNFSSWIGNSKNTKHIRSCDAAIGNGQVKFKHTLNLPSPLIKLGEYTANFFDQNTFCGERIRLKNNTCKNKIPNFSWECKIENHQFELNYSNGLKSGAYACKKNGNYIQMAHLSSCFDVIEN